MSGKQSGHTPQLAIKNVHHVVLWSAKERNTEEKDTDKKGKGCLQKKQRQTEAEQLKQQGHCVSASGSRVQQPLVLTAGKIM